VIDHIYSSVYLLPAWRTLCFCLCLSVGRVTEKSCWWIWWKSLEVWDAWLVELIRFWWWSRISKWTWEIYKRIIAVLIFGTAELYLIGFNGLGRGFLSLSEFLWRGGYVFIGISYLVCLFVSGIVQKPCNWSSQISVEWWPVVHAIDWEFEFFEF